MINIAILGFGVVGGGTADLLTKNKKLIEARVGAEINIKYILDLRDFPESPYKDKIVHDFSIIESDKDVSIIAELIGGVGAAYDFTRRALSAGKHVVTSNKELVATHGDELLALAEKHGVRYLFEASVGGGIPILRAYSSELAANDVVEISGILNGTTNYILTKMINDGESFDLALGEAQAKGYAESDPSADVDGLDACRKTCILAATLTHRLADCSSIHTEGIRGIRAADVAAADKIGCSIKLLGRVIKKDNGEIYAVVAPFMINRDCPLSHISDVYNGVLVRGNFVGDVMFYGRGAGALPTASAVASDIANLIAGECPLSSVGTWKRDDDMLSDFKGFSCRHYIAVSGVTENAVSVIFSDAEFIESDCITFVTSELSESDVKDRLKRIAAIGGTVKSRIRMFN